MQIIIPLCGNGERFSKKGYTIPKPMIPVNGKEMIRHVLDNLSIDPHHDALSILYGPHLVHCGFIELVKQHYPFIYMIPLSKSTAGAAETVQMGIDILMNESNRMDPCLLLDCHTAYAFDIIGTAKAAQANAVFYFHDATTDGATKYSYICMDEKQHCITAIAGQKISDTANTGGYLFAHLHELHDYCHDVVTNNVRYNNEHSISCVIKKMLEDGHVFHGIHVQHDDMCSFGTPEQVEDILNTTHAFLFDLDGTLVNTTNIYKMVWASLLAPYYVDVTDDVFMEYIDSRDDSIALKMLLPTSYKDILGNVSQAKDKLFLQNIEHVERIPGCIEFLRRIKLRGHRVAVVTNANRAVAQQILVHAGIAPFVDNLVIGNECAHPKPYPDPYVTALAAFGMPSSQAIIFEDSRTGVLSAQGVQPKAIIGISAVSAHTNHFKELRVSHVVPSYVGVLLADVLDAHVSSSSTLKDDIFRSLKNRYPVMDIDVSFEKLKGGYIADVLKASVMLNGSTDTLECVVKMRSDNQTQLSTMAEDLDLYNREHYFYETIRDFVDIPSPKSYGILRDANFQPKGVILENLHHSGTFVQNINLNTESIDVSLSVISYMAKMHAQCWGLKLNEKFPSLRKNNDPCFFPKWGSYIQKRWDTFQMKWAHVLKEQVKIGQVIVDKFHAIQEHMSVEPLTLCHGDVKSANLFFKVHEATWTPYFIDWQYIIYGKGVQDLVFFMIESFDIETIQQYSDVFLRYYHTKLQEYGVKNYSYDMCVNDYKIAACFYPFFVAIWFGTTPSDHLIDINFPFFFLQKLFYFLQAHVDPDLLLRL